MNMSPFASQPRAAARMPIEDALPFLRRVYTLFTGGIVLAIVGALAALYIGNPVLLPSDGEILRVPPIVAFELEHGIVMLLVYIAAFFGASFARRVQGLNVLALLGYTFITGLFLAPTLFIAQLMASHGSTLDASPVRDAFLLTGAAFTGLTGYVFVTRKDFSFMGAALSMGLWVIIGASILGIFIHSAALQLAVASVGVLLFSGYILYDTSRLLHGRADDDAVGAALGLFLNVINLFLMLLRILSQSRDR
jgi:modulator of FtsH protease